MNQITDPATLRTSGPNEAEAGAIVTVDLAAIAANWKLLAQRVSPVECAAVVKADAYGCGLEQVAATLAKAGCKTYFVADLAEARRVRAVAPETVVYVLTGAMPGTARAFADAYARPVINSMTELAEWDAFVAASNWRGGAALHVDTGMNRLGVTPDEASAFAARVQSENHGISLLMSHFVCSEQPSNELNESQMRQFREIRTLYRGIPSSLANSSGIFLGPATHCDLVRPGIALYGGNPTPGHANPMRPVVELKGRIVQMRTVKKGETVGYGAAWTARRPTRLAVVAVGYADGFMRLASSSDGRPGGKVQVAGKLCPLAGRISMDLIEVDVTDLPEGTPRRGELVTVIGGRVDIDDFANALGTIGYEVLTGLGKRCMRIYKSDAPAAA
jgi:alanine racemase